jgi:exopolyphosphatase / guanosine-5'-triphosphate,3'-diphosphate pyrophosphatase
MSNLRASIDIGSNSVLLLIGEIKDGKVVEKIRDSRITSLGKNLDKEGVFSSDSMKATHTALLEYIEVCKVHGILPEVILATATEASRVAKNGADFYANIFKETGLSVKIIHAKAEAELTARGILQGTKFKESKAIIMDIGGASTEFIQVDTQTMSVIDSISLPVGSVRAIDWLLADEFVPRLNKIIQDYANALEAFKTPYLYCVAGTMTSLGNMFLKRKEFVEDDVHGVQLHESEIDQLFKKFSAYTAAQFDQEFPFLQKRAQSIRGGLHLVYHLIHALKVEQIEISTYGLRYGSLLQGEILPTQLA